MTQSSDAIDIVPVGKVPPLGVVPARMHAFVIRPERFGEPKQSFQAEEMPVWDIGPDEVLVQVMAAGVNYNGIWAGLGQPVDVLQRHGENFHIAGSDASGVVWKVGSAVRNWKVGDEVVAEAQVKESKGKKRVIEVSAKVGETQVLSGTMTAFVLEEHVLSKK